MGGTGSGRRRIKAPAKGFSLTPPDGTLAGWTQQLDDIQQGVVAGFVDPRTADTLIAAAKAGIGSCVNDEERAMIAEYDRQITRLEEIHRLARAREASDRTHSAGDDGEG